MHCRWRGGSLRGVEGLPVGVEVQMSRGLPGISLVGLAGAATRESRERVMGALRESGYRVPEGRVTINLAPAEEPKEGSAFDLPIALALLEVSGQIQPRRGRDWWLLGELALDGRLLPVRGALALALTAQAQGAPGVILPEGNGVEARLLRGIEVATLPTLRDAVAWAEGKAEAALLERPERRAEEVERRAPLDLAAVVGLSRVRRALEIAAVGAHNLLLIGSPGTGKSMMARILGDLLPPLVESEAQEVMTVRSVAGLPVNEDCRRPFRAPHHTVSVAGFLGSLVRGGRPGEITLAHRGLLFLDELPEFNRAVREALREPMEDGHLVLSRGAGSLCWPARFQLVAAMNPCPCGQRLRGEEHCRCTPAQVRGYFARISGPLLDRIDLVMEVPLWRAADHRQQGESTRTVRRRVAGASRRLGEARPIIGEAETRWLDRQLEGLGASFRLREKLRSVAASVAALEKRDRVERGNLLEAMDFCIGLRRRLEPGSFNK